MSSEKKLKKFIHPMLANEIADPFDDKDWLFEIKWDGYRAIAEKKKNKLSLYSRNGLSFLERYPVIADQLLCIEGDAVLDGEIAAVDKKGRSDFQLLQHYAENQDKPIQYQIFDLINLNGRDTTKLPLIKRKELLQKLIPENDVIKYSDHITEAGKRFFKAAKQKELEGIMAKKMDSKYFPGKRTNEWLKIKNHKTIEAIIAGYTEPSGSRKFFGALILAVREGRDLKYIGHTGGGFNHKSLKDIYNLLQPLKSDKSPFVEKIKTNTPVTWVKPCLICEVKFAEVTADGKLRQPIFERIRTDKNVNDLNTTFPSKMAKR